MLTQFGRTVEMEPFFAFANVSIQNEILCAIANGTLTPILRTGSASRKRVSALETIGTIRIVSIRTLRTCVLQNTISFSLCTFLTFRIQSIALLTQFGRAVEMKPFFAFANVSV